MYDITKTDGRLIGDHRIEYILRAISKVCSRAEIAVPADKEQELRALAVAFVRAAVHDEAERNVELTPVSLFNMCLSLSALEELAYRHIDTETEPLRAWIHTIPGYSNAKRQDQDDETREYYNQCARPLVIALMYMTELSKDIDGAFALDEPYNPATLWLSLYELEDHEAYKNFAVVIMMRSILKELDGLYLDGLPLDTEEDKQKFVRMSGLVSSLCRSMVADAKHPDYTVKPSDMLKLARDFNALESFAFGHVRPGNLGLTTWLVCLPGYSRHSTGDQEDVTYEHYAFYAQPVVDALKKLVDAGDRF